MNVFAMARRITKKHALEYLCVAALLCMGLHLVFERCAHREMPSGDEGSWLSVAAELSRGHGFSTHWLEYQFQKPYMLPRPDDFRYPGLTLLLAAAFKMAGVSYPVALRTCALIFACFCLAVYCTVRKVFGVATALLTLSAMTFSLNQLQWNSVVYSEGLFGLVLAATVYLSISLDARGKQWWIAMGAAIGFLSLVRPNGILLAAGLAWQYLRMRALRAPGGVPFRYAAYAVCALIAVMLPWFMRNTLFFGNPLHIAGGAGLLQRSFQEPVNESFFAFIRSAGIFFPIKATLTGAPGFIKILNTFEHGLCVPLLCFAAIGFFQRRRFFNPFVLAGFCVTFVFCCYAAYKSYAGVRYFSAFLPFVYAYGIHAVVSTINRVPWASRHVWVRYGAAAFIGASFLAPVAYPHRYYERVYAKRPNIDMDFSGHLSTLNSLLSKGDSYFAGRLGQLNFLSEYNCVGVQEDFDSSLAQRSLCAFKPKLLALTDEEANTRRFTDFIGLARLNGCMVDQRAKTSFGVYYSLKRPAAPERRP
jgi:hypothetical protein